VKQAGTMWLKATTLMAAATVLRTNSPWEGQGPGTSWLCLPGGIARGLRSDSPPCPKQKHKDTRHEVFFVCFVCGTRA
jgi:hypothetical protein